ncbi:DoxX family membrane protein [Hymenobacter sp. 5317J-9]|uniref:DoxX family protein n=1 Tax=Hymenobacter sp. 5317J-9 TaxID=2932250 RepID=UPI001FD64105|nr:DoxX family membrane protein [Hymenobacter sp. 5317J-9]UOQ95899.1 DoxX family membrane protein [Hymenobacter sp. 5317J-9]
MRHLFRPLVLPNWWQDALLALPRIVCGYLLASNFGAAKFGLPWSPPDNNLGLFEVAFWFPQDVAAYGGIFAMFPNFFAWMGAFSEAIGGMLLVLGLLTRPAAFLVSCTMLVAMFMQQFQEGLWNMLPAMGFLWAALPALVLGSGRFGLDYLLTKSGGLRPRPGLVALALAALLLPGCVQQAHDKTVVYLLDVSGHPDVQQVGVRGRDKPLSWDYDLQLTPIKKDSLYRAVVTTHTGYKVTEVKFTINGDYELKGKENRRIEFGSADTAVYRARFDVMVP